MTVLRIALLSGAAVSAVGAVAMWVAVASAAKPHVCTAQAKDLAKTVVVAAIGNPDLVGVVSVTPDGEIAPAMGTGKLDVLLVKTQVADPIHWVRVYYRKDIKTPDGCQNWGYQYMPDGDPYNPAG